MQVCNGCRAARELPFICEEPSDPLKRLALVEHDTGQKHEAYDVTIAALFIVFMLIVIALAFVLH